MANLTISTHKDFLRSLLNKRLRVTIKDGRVIEGSFLCTDKDRNIVLGSCEEFLTQKDVDEVDANPKSKTANIRTLGLAIIPGDQICNVAVDKEFLSQTQSENADTVDSPSCTETTASQDGSLTAECNEQCAENERLIS